jgi:DNA-binding transcriptional LysR family regulator
MTRLAQLDLNLVVALEALLAERNVTRAARRVGLSQPAMSNALARLRAALGDPLLVRARGRMVPTEIALEIGRTTHGALRQIERALGAQAPFDPATSRRTFTIAASDYVGLVLLAPLMNELATAAPHVVVRVVPVQPDLSLDELETGGVDLTVGHFRKVPSSLHRLQLFEDRFVVVMRADHPAASRPLRRRDLATLPQLQVSPQGYRTSAVDRELRRADPSRRVAMLAPHFLLTLMVTESDFVSVVPERLARALERKMPLAIRPPPFPLSALSVGAYWHERSHHDRAHVWLRARLAAHAGRSR